VFGFGEYPAGRYVPVENVQNLLDLGKDRGSVAHTYLHATVCGKISSCLCRLLATGLQTTVWALQIKYGPNWSAYFATLIANNRLPTSQPHLCAQLVSPTTPWPPQWLQRQEIILTVAHLHFSHKINWQGCDPVISCELA
jgi:hypothetical protein